jgi:hypothetical protein
MDGNEQVLDYDGDAIRLEKEPLEPISTACKKAKGNKFWWPEIGK